MIPVEEHCAPQQELGFFSIVTIACTIRLLEVIKQKNHSGLRYGNCDPGVSNRFGELPFFLTHQSDSLYWFQIGIIVSVIRNNEVIPSLKSER